ncbi:hypothetical protein HYPP_02687 [Hyphomicrobium sp. ghe19]|nr:hypothetical protein HYPP_02687 [Hyphomicrobium sp. ghe19]
MFGPPIGRNSTLCKPLSKPRRGILKQCPKPERLDSISADGSYRMPRIMHSCGCRSSVTTL